MRIERLKTISEAKRQQLQQAEQQTVTQIVAKQAKEAIRDLKEAYRDLQYCGEKA